MANKEADNTYFVDSTTSTSNGDVVSRKVRIKSILLTSTGSNGSASVLNRANQNTQIAKLQVPANDMKQLRFPEGEAIVANGISVNQITNCTITFVLENET